IEVGSAARAAAGELWILGFHNRQHHELFDPAGPTGELRHAAFVDAVAGQYLRQKPEQSAIFDAVNPELVVGSSRTALVEAVARNGAPPHHHRSGDVG